MVGLACKGERGREGCTGCFQVTELDQRVVGKGSGLKRGEMCCEKGRWFVCDGLNDRVYSLSQLSFLCA
jgi:hypothetical protein